MTQKTMKQNSETELNAVFDKTIAFLRDKWGNMRHDIALEITGKSDDEVRVIWDRVTTDFWNMGVDYFIREYNKILRKALKI